MPATDELRREAAALGLKMTSKAFAEAMDSKDALAHLRSEFSIPRRHGTRKQDEGSSAGGAANPTQTTRHDASENEAGGEELTYLCGNSLGLMPKESRRLVDQEFDVWAARSAILGVLLVMESLMCKSLSFQGSRWPL